MEAPSDLMRRVLLFVTILVLVGNCLGQAKPGAIGPSNVWQPPTDFVANANKACGGSSDSHKFADCFIAQMAKAGAPASAVSLTREFYKENHGELAILTSFAHVGPVDIAWVVYPLHKPSNYGLFLVNGDPRFVNAEDMKQLDEKGMENSFQYENLKSLFPKVALFPSNRDGRTWPNYMHGSHHELQFIVGYPLRNGCATCSSAGAALFTWNFTTDGKFTGTSFMGMTPAPVTSPVATPE